jgi:hypothetical protein
VSSPVAIRVGRPSFRPRGAWHRLDYRPRQTLGTILDHAPGQSVPDDAPAGCHCGAEVVEEAATMRSPWHATEANPGASGVHRALQHAPSALNPPSTLVRRGSPALRIDYSAAAERSNPCDLGEYTPVVPVQIGVFREVLAQAPRWAVWLPCGLQSTVSMFIAAGPDEPLA